MQTFGERLLAARKAKKMTQQQLALKAGVTQTTISDIERGRNSSSTELPALAKALGMTVDELLTGRDVIEQNITPAPLGHRLIPIINDVQAGMWKEIQADFHTSEMLLTDLDLSSSAFALTIKGDSMLPDFREGDRVIIDPEVSPVPGDFVAAVNGSNAATFKKYRERGVNAEGITVFELVPLNNDYPTLRSDIEHISIVGTMMEHRKYRKR